MTFYAVQKRSIFGAKMALNKKTKKSIANSNRLFGGSQTKLNYNLRRKGVFHENAKVFFN